MISNEQLIGFIKSQPVGVGCAVLTILLGAGIYLRNDKVSDSEALLDQKITQGERIDANLKNGVELPEQLAALASSRQQVEARLIRADELAKNKQYFYKLESETGVKLVEISQNAIPNAVQGAKTIYLPIGFSVAVRGDYPHLIDFLQRLEKGQRYCRVISANLSLLSMTSKDRGAAELTLNLSLELLGQR
ncbi:MAG TPA: hypothetical protein PLU52_04365 [Opitutaceae bacterium]|nr:hypothetical protein [Opitutaceae bacterium]HND60933.1 hypothetical protein [Opitutaceae bacterium]